MQPAESVVVGIVEAGPLRPVIIVGDSRPITRPVAGAVVEALHEGNVVAASTTDDVGSYLLRVQPGTYLVRVTAAGLHSKEPGQTVTVSAGESLTVSFVLDTGIRCRWGHRPATCPLGARCIWGKRG